MASSLWNVEVQSILKVAEKVLTSQLSAGGLYTQSRQLCFLAGDEGLGVWSQVINGWLICALMCD